MIKFESKTIYVPARYRDGQDLVISTCQLRNWVSEEIRLRRVFSKEQVQVDEKEFKKTLWI